MRDPLDQPPGKPLERRPISARNLRVFQVMADWLASKGASANSISIAGMAWGITAGIALAGTTYSEGLEQRLLWLAAALLIQLRLLANMLDGMVAVQSGTVSPVGELYNEVPDRLSDVATLIGAGYAVGGEPMLGYLAACAALFTAYIRAMGKGAGAPQEFCGPMAKQQRMFLVTVTAIWYGLTPQDWQPRWEDMNNGGIMAAVLALIAMGSLITALRRLWRIAGNLRRPAD